MKRVLVLGAGMAGSAAALAARAAGAEVTLVAEGTGATAFAGGAVWGAEPLEPLELGGWFERIPEGAVLATVLGDLARAGWAQPAQAAGAIRPGQRVGLVALRGAPQLFDAAWAADGLRGHGVAAEPLELALPLGRAEVQRSVFAWAAALDGDEAARALIAPLRRLATAVDLLLLPPLLGLRKQTFEVLRTAVGTPLGELVASAPSVPGLRLWRALESSVLAAGCQVIRDRVCRLASGRAELATGESLAFDSAVLATGRFLGGGLRGGDGSCEPLSGLPLVLSDGTAPSAAVPRSALVGSAPGEPAPMFEVGLRVDRQHRPIDADGKALPWLRVAGALIAGADRGLAFAQRTGLGAGRAAAGREGGEHARVAEA